MIGINTSDPTAMLHVHGTVRFGSLTADNNQANVLVADADGYVYTRAASTLGGANAWALDGVAFGAEKKFGTTDPVAIPFITSNTEQMRIAADGSIMMGTNIPRGKLAVNGHVYATKIKVTASGWADYVFENDYKLMPLEELEAFVKKNKHLPEVPTAQEVEANGADLGDTQVALLKKIEELTLYMIEQQKQTKALKDEVKELRKSR